MPCTSLKKQNASTRSGNIALLTTIFVWKSNAQFQFSLYPSFHLEVLFVTECYVVKLTGVCLQSATFPAGNRTRHSPAQYRDACQPFNTSRGSTFISRPGPYSSCHAGTIFFAEPVQKILKFTKRDLLKLFMVVTLFRISIHNCQIHFHNGLEHWGKCLPLTGGRGCYCNTNVLIKTN